MPTIQALYKHENLMAMIKQMVLFYEPDLAI